MTNQKEELRILRIEAGRILGTSICWTCHASNKIDKNWKRKNGRSGFTIHHLEYRFNEKKYKDFGRSPKDKIEYYNYLLPIIKEHPTKFKYLCNKCHINFSQHFDRRRLSDILLKRLLKLRKITK